MSGPTRRPHAIGRSVLLAASGTALFVWIACGEAQDTAGPPGDSQTVESTGPGGIDRGGSPPAPPTGGLDGLGQRAERALAELDESAQTIRGQIGGPIAIPEGLPRDLPLPVDATVASDSPDAGAPGILVLSVAHPVDRTRGFFRAALRGRGFEILSEERSATGFELHARRPSEELVITGAGAADATQVSITRPRS